MPDYKAPLRDIRFVINNLLDAGTLHQALPGYEEASEDVIDAILEEAARFSQEVLAPLNRVGDEQGCSWSEEGVRTPEGFREAYRRYVENGWPALSAPPEFGGQGMPYLLNMAVNEMAGTANWAWHMYTGLSHGAIRTLEAHGTEAQKKRFLKPLIEGRWSGTMCLTEAHCGSDLGQLRTKAEPRNDGTWAISGTKIFISAGEHDLTDNIVHIVIARTPDAPPGTKGISLFIVPKFNVDEEGGIGERNAVHCASIEHKMGINGSATCVMNFDGATGYLVGEENAGMALMFTFMNTARIGTAMQGLAHGELALQGSLDYARERLSMRSLSGPKNPDGPADPIIVHADVRRMLLTQKAFTEGSRALIYFLSQQSDIATRGEPDAAARAEELLALLTPVAKAFVTETGFESANHGMQVFGGHGYIREWGMEQNVRDARIATLYEGTTGIQALDLIGRKVLGSGGKLLQVFTDMMGEFCEKHDGGEEQDLVYTLASCREEWLALSQHIGEAARRNPDEAGAAAVDYLMYSGYVTLAYFWARMAVLARRRLAESPPDADFYEAKLFTARFYFKRLLPRAQAHRFAIESGADNLMNLAAEAFGP